MKERVLLVPRLIEKWECDFNVKISENEELQRFIKENTESIKRKSLDPRDAFFGSPTGNTVKVYDCRESGKIKYVDVGQEEYQTIVGPNNDISKMDGLIVCDVLAP
ncbi:hypothetical protein TSAR_000610 [Trichomalopsis sarcophagae]|uniref:Uncharacterized protein n=1 Tax=Trichomalopsis sarcophagae TaxID=543379 RepID=A0A232FAU1_9HYME|nr:hypothetical protein TSAR_000610 [Trichomalopsis sarcophagae]